MLKHEFGLEGIADPLGGSFYIEAMTENLEREAAQPLNELEGLEAQDAQKYIQLRLGKHAKANEATVVGVDIQTQGPSPRPRLIKTIRKKSRTR